MKITLWIRGTNDVKQERKKTLEGAGYKLVPTDADEYSYEVEFNTLEDFFKITELFICDITVFSCIDASYGIEIG